MFCQGREPAPPRGGKRNRSRHLNDDADGQNEVLAFLADPATHGGHAVKRIDTHAASVFLAGDHALKIKRAVRFPFLDYSTLDKRKAACDAELAVNAPYAPDIYRRVVADYATSQWGARDRRQRPASRVRSCDAPVRRTAHARSSGWRNRRRAADALGHAIAAAHARAKPVDAEPWIAALGSYIDEHVSAFRQRRDIFDGAENDGLGHASRTAYERIVPLLRERGRRGLIRRIHGDLHLGNIALDWRQTGAVRRHRVFRHHRVGRRALRSRLPLDGPLRTRADPGCKCRFQPVSQRSSAHRGPRWARGTAILSDDARGDPRQSDGGAHGTRRDGGPGPHCRRRRAPISPSRSAQLRRQSPPSSPSAAFQALAKRDSRVRWRRQSGQCRAR